MLFKAKEAAMLQSLLPYLGSPSFHALALILASTAAFQSLIALWAATSPRHWFWRALAMWGAVMALVPIRAYQPAIVFAISSPLIVAAIMAIRWRRQSKERRAAQSDAAPLLSSIRFGLSDIFLLMLVVGLMLAGLLYVQKRLDNFNAVNSGLTALALVAVTMVAFAAWQSERRIAPALLLIATIALLAISIPRLGSNSEDYDALVLLGTTFSPSYRTYDAIRIAMALSVFALLLLLALVLLTASQRQDEALSRQGWTRGVLFAAALLVGLPLAAIYWQMLWLSPLPPNFEGGTTNYERLAQIAERMQATSIHKAPAATAKERSDLIAETAELVQPANFIPYDMTAESLRDQFYLHTKEAQSFRNLARTIDSEAGAAITRGNYAQASDLTLTNVRLGVMLQRGGTVIEYVVGVAIQGVAQNRFIELRRDLPPEESRRVIATLEHAILEAEDVRSVAKRDRAMGERSYGWAARLENVIESAGIATNLKPFLQAAVRRNAGMRLLQTDLALRLYQHDHGELPRDLEQLVPTYLPALPLDPYSGQLLRYRIDGDDFILYSIGKDRRDDGGTFTNSPTYYRAPAAGYDYDLDTQTRP